MAIELSDEGIISFMQKEIGDSRISKAIVYHDKREIPGGATIYIGRKPYHIPFDAQMIFVDNDPMANWGHSCTYFFIPTEGNQFRRHEDTFPPYFGKYPETWNVILRYGKKPPHSRYFNVYNNK